MQAPLREPAANSSTFDIVAAIDAYDAAATQLVARCLDMELCADTGRWIDAIREYGVSDPALMVLSLHLVIAHSELVCTIWRNASVGVCPEMVQEVRARHALALHALRAAADRSSA